MRACARNKLSCDVVFLPRLPIVEFPFRGLHRESSLRDIIRLTSNWKGYRSFFTMLGNRIIEGKWTRQVNLEVIDNQKYDISIKEVSHMLVNVVDGRSLNACLLSYTEVGLSNDVLPILSIHPFDCLHCLTSWDIVSLLILRGIVFLVVSWDIHSLLIWRDIHFLIAPRDIVFPINSRDIVFPNWHDRKLFEFGIWIWSMSSSL